MHTLIRRIARRIGRYEAIAFMSGFILMSYELVASRILAPTIGTSMYVWTSVIGVMIAALACGYAVGGWAADKRGKPQDIVLLLLAAAGGITITCVFYNAVLTSVALLLSDPRLQGVIAATLLFAPASFVMGMLSPYLAKLRISSLSTTGRSVAGLGALNSLGGITGTFLTGFVFFNYIGSLQTLFLLVLLLLACSWIIMFRRQSRDRLIVSIVLCAIVSLQLALPAQADTIADIDTPTSHYKVIDTVYNDRPFRVLIMGPGGFQSGIYTDGNNDLAFTYTRQIANVVQAAPHKARMLILGGGAFTLPAYLAQHYPDAQIDVVEIDPKLPAIAARYFNYHPTANIHVISQDARAYLRTANTRYDIAAIDVYNDESVPFAFATQEYAADLKRVVTPDGVVAANIIASTSPACMPLLSGLHRSYTSSFSQSRVYPLSDANTNHKQNFVAVYSNAPLAWTTQIAGPTVTPAPAARPLTDNFAPTERLIQQCT